MKTSDKALIARHTVLIVRQIVALFRCSASPTEYRKPPLAKKRKATQTICSTFRAWLRAVWCLIWGPSTLHRYLIPSAENLYLSYRWSSGKASGSIRSLNTLSRLKALLSTSASSSTTSVRNGHAIVRAGKEHTILGLHIAYYLVRLYKEHLC